MNRWEIWVTFAMGAVGQFPTATQAAAAADDLLHEFEERFERATDTLDEEWRDRGDLRTARRYR